MLMKAGFHEDEPVGLEPGGNPEYVVGLDESWYTNFVLR
jgi:hypothetical protein